jgi:hypothetical protein
MDRISELLAEETDAPSPEVGIGRISELLADTSEPQVEAAPSSASRIADLLSEPQVPRPPNPVIAAALKPPKPNINEQQGIAEARKVSIGAALGPTGDTTRWPVDSRGRSLRPNISYSRQAGTFREPFQGETAEHYDKAQYDSAPERKRSLLSHFAEEAIPRAASKLVGVGAILESKVQGLVDPILEGNVKSLLPMRDAAERVFNWAAGIKKPDVPPPEP